MGFERRIQIPEYANLQKFASNCEQLLTFLGEITKDLMTPYINDPILSNQLLRQDQKDVVDISCDMVGPTKKGRPPKGLGLRFCQVSFLSKKRWRQ